MHKSNSNSYYRNSKVANKIASNINQILTQSWNIMEVCGGQTHSILQYGIEDLLNKQLNLIHGPGCPVCVTPIEIIEHALMIASLENIIFCSYGDMLRVPGREADLLELKSLGHDIRIVLSPLDCLKIAKKNEDKSVIFFAVGFETTAPANAMLAYQANKLGVKNIFLLTSHVLVPPALELLLSEESCIINGFLGPGHVCSVVGYDSYEMISEKFKVPIAITGFEPVDILEGILFCVEALENKQVKVINQYERAVKKGGNQFALEIMNDVFTVCDKNWRGIGLIPNSGLRLSSKYSYFDASVRFPYTKNYSELYSRQESLCISGDVLKGLKKPNDCSAFGKLCTPENPMGATMVSSEGTCANYYKFHKVSTHE